MKLLVLALAALIAGGGSASPAPVNMVQHEKRSDLDTNQWVKRDKLESSVVLPMKIGLKQRNLHRAEEYIMDVSDPQSPNYGKHWSVARVAQTFAPSQDTMKAVQRWLVDADISAERHAWTGGRGWIQFNATVAEAERLLGTEYFVYEHAESGHENVACESYSVPSLVREHIDFITPTVHFNNRVRRQTAVGPKAPEGPIHRRQAIPRPGDPSDITQCVGNAIMLPKCLFALYGIPEKDLDIQAPNSLAVPQYQAWYRQSDLDMFFNYTKGIVGVAPLAYSIDGGDASKYIQVPAGQFGYLSEVNLDLDVAMSMVYPLNVTLFATGDYTVAPEAQYGLQDDFLDAIDGSYCDYDGGDDPVADPTFPDTAPQPGAWNQSRECGTLENVVPNVLSTSYMMIEIQFTRHYMERQCYEYMKLALRGVTVINCSGDGGVSSHSVCNPPDSTNKRFLPTFPNTCPYVTSVGATMMRPNAAVTDTNIEIAVSQPELQYKSSGGFSDIFPLPSYQQPAVATYFQQHAPNISAPYTYNNTQAVRGFPDVAFNGMNFVTVVNGLFALNGGTSMSAPGFASVITRINQARLNAGKSVVGFINPVLYANPQLFWDITEGDNICGGSGFLAVEGWDPVTGLGTPKFGDMLEFFLTLP